MGDKDRDRGRQTEIEIKIVCRGTLLLSFWAILVSGSPASLGLLGTLNFLIL